MYCKMACQKHFNLNLTLGKQSRKVKVLSTNVARNNFIISAYMLYHIYA